MALSQSSPILPQNAASSIGRRQRDGCSKGTKRYRAGLSSGYGHVAQSWVRVFHFLRGTAMWRRAGLSSGLNLRKLSTAVGRRIEDEGDWSYASEWRGEESEGHTVLRSTSNKGNGIVSVVAYPSSKPSELHWASTERWLQQRYEEIQECRQDNERFRVLGYQWRALRFNDDTRQSTVKVLAAYRRSEPESIALMQQPHCLALPYLKSMIAAGLATIASCNYNLMNAVTGTENIRILCIGQGGGSLPLFLASKIQGAIVDVVEIDPLVISASVRAMGFPAFSIMTPSGKRAVSPNTMDTVMWKGIHERLFLHESDAEDFVLNTTIQYDMVFVDAYDGEDIFPRKLWDPHSPFLKALSSRLHPDHGTVVVNLHSDSDILNPDGSAPSVLQQTLPMGKYVSRVCLQAYKDVVVGRKDSGLGFTVSVPWLCNSSLVVCRGFVVNGEDCNRDVIMDTLISKSFELENAEVLSGLVHLIYNSTDACLVAESTPETSERRELVGVADVTVSRYQAILQYLPSRAPEYLYMVGIAVLKSFRWKKIATVVLKACDTLSVKWGFVHLAVRAYEDDFGAGQLYSYAGYRVISSDPPWLRTWIGRNTVF